MEKPLKERGRQSSNAAEHYLQVDSEGDTNLEAGQVFNGVEIEMFGKKKRPQLADFSAKVWTI